MSLFLGDLACFCCFLEVLLEVFSAVSWVFGRLKLLAVLGQERVFLTFLNFLHISALLSTFCTFVNLLLKSRVLGCWE